MEVVRQELVLWNNFTIPEKEASSHKNNIDNPYKKKELTSTLQSI